MRSPQLKRLAGPASIVAMVVALAALWLVARPAGQDSASYVGQFFGAQAVLLWSIALVLISTLPFVEDWFDGIDRAAIWHRRVAIAGLIAVIPHLALATSDNGRAGGLGNIAFFAITFLVLWAILPRWRSVTPAFLRRVLDQVRASGPVSAIAGRVAGYERWRAVHRFTGVFVGIGLAHALIDGTPYDAAPILRWSVAVPGFIGITFYLYRELLARRIGPIHDYVVHDIRALPQDLTEIVLRPLGPPLRFAPGQFALVYLEGKEGWQRHPFTLASAPAEPVLRLTVKALGDYTSGLGSALQRGMPAVVGGPFGRFKQSKGTGRQAWIAGGGGLTPVRSWVRSLDEVRTADRIDLFVTSPGESPYAQELRAAEAAHPGLTVHLIDSTTGGRLTAEEILRRCGGNPGELSVFMCGPTPMIDQFQRDLRGLGVRGRNIHREHFDWR